MSQKDNKTAKRKYEEYKDETDTSDEEDTQNTVGNIPLKWYNDFEHYGYDVSGSKLMKRNFDKNETKFERVLKQIENPDFHRLAKHPQTNEDLVLTDETLQLIDDIESNRIPDEQKEAYSQPWVDWFSSEVQHFPVTNAPDHKRSFLPSITEKKKISEMVHKLKTGQMKTEEQLEKMREKKRRKTERESYDLWKDDDRSEARRSGIHDHLPFPKYPYPTPEMSYNPPPEYCFNEKEIAEWHSLAATPHLRKFPFIPQQYPSLRVVPACSYLFEKISKRLRDMYLCPRQKRLRLDVKAEDLLPKLPKPIDLKPYPYVEHGVFRGHKNIVRSIAISRDGEYMLSGSDDRTLKLWPTFCEESIQTKKFDDAVSCVAWCPSKVLKLVSVVTHKHVYMLDLGIDDVTLCSNTDLLLRAAKKEAGGSAVAAGAVMWQPVPESKWRDGVRIHLEHSKEVCHMDWHPLGDYFVTVVREGQSKSVILHQLTTYQSTFVVRKNMGPVQCAVFHPFKPILFVALQRQVYVYDIAASKMLNRLLANSLSVSGMAVHAGGDNLVVSTFEGKVLWFDLDWGTRPYKTLDMHNKKSVRTVAFHPRYPLFASGADDATCMVYHGKVSELLSENAVIVPLTRLSTHKKGYGLGVMNVCFHPQYPYLFSAGADCTIRLYTSS